MAILVAVFGVGGVGALLRYIASAREKRIERVELAKAEVIKAEADAKQRLAEALDDLSFEVREIRVVQSAMLEQGRRRDDNRKRRESQQNQRRGPHVPPRDDDFAEEEDTGIGTILVEERRRLEGQPRRRAKERGKTPAPGVPITPTERPPRPGTHSDKVK